MVTALTVASETVILKPYSSTFIRRKNYFELRTDIILETWSESSMWETYGTTKHNYKSVSSLLNLNRNKVDKYIKNRALITQWREHSLFAEENI